MKQCRECGTLSPDDTVFCYICGTKFPELPEEVKKVKLLEARKKASSSVGTAGQEIDVTNLLLMLSNALIRLYTQNGAPHYTLTAIQRTRF